MILAATTELPQWLVMGQEIIFSVLGMAGVALLAYLGKKAKDKGVDAELVEDLTHGVQTAFKDIVKDFRAKTDDGKLTDEEKASARTYAIEAAKKVASPAVKRKLLSMGADKLGSLVSRIVNRQKKNK